MKLNFISLLLLTFTFVLAQLPPNRPLVSEESSPSRALKLAKAAYVPIKIVHEGMLLQFYDYMPYIMLTDFVCNTLLDEEMAEKGMYLARMIYPVLCVRNKGEILPYRAARFVCNVAIPKLQELATNIQQSGIPQRVLEKARRAVKLIKYGETNANDQRSVLTITCNDIQCENFGVDVNEDLLEIVIHNPDITSSLPCHNGHVGPSRG